MAQASRPGSTRSLPKGDVDRRHVNFLVQTFLAFFGRGGFEKQLQGFPEIGAGFLDGLALAGDVQFRAQGDVPITLALDNCRELLQLRGRSGLGDVAQGNAA